MSIQENIAFVKRADFWLCKSGRYVRNGSVCVDKN